MCITWARLLYPSKMSAPSGSVRPVMAAPRLITSSRVPSVLVSRNLR